MPLIAIQLDNEPSIDDKVNSVNPDLHLLRDPKAECVKSHFGDCFQARSGKECQVVRQPMQAFWEALDDVRNIPTRHPIRGDCALQRGRDLLRGFSSRKAADRIRDGHPPRGCRAITDLERCPMGHKFGDEESRGRKPGDGGERRLRHTMGILRDLKVNSMIVTTPDSVRAQGSRAGQPRTAEHRDDGGLARASGRNPSPPYR